jgi:23S rRNA G2445 N2-methylase RlmL
MSRKRPPDFSLDAAIADVGFTPKVADLPGLLDRIARADDASELAERALLRLGGGAAAAVDARATRDAAPMRPRWVRLLGRIASLTPTDDVVARLVAHLDDDDARARRLAASALGRVRTHATEPALASALDRERAPDVREALIEALGKVGGSHALSALEAARAAEPGEATDETLGRARLRIERTLGRSEPSRFAAERAATAPTPVVLRCRAGLERLLCAEVDASFAPRVPTGGDGGRVEATLVGAPAALFRARTMLSLAFPLRPARLPAGADTSPDALAHALAGVIASDEAAAILAHFTEGPVRYRIHWAEGGKRRAVVWKTAHEVAARRPELVNDPSGSTWEASVTIARGGESLRVELVPRFDDARFAYRLGDVPAASHPTLAAALARVGGVRDDDVVWDPFAGSGTELCERALAGPYRRLFGTDLDPAALAVAARNLEAAHARADLVNADALVWSPPEPPTLILTNPPMGRRVLRGPDLGAVLERLVAHAAAVLAPGGRLVWLSPMPGRTAAAASRAGLALTSTTTVDMGGFHADLQAFKKPASRPAPEPLDAAGAQGGVSRAGGTSARRTSPRPRRPG